jgi:hypothetical protein
VKQDEIQIGDVVQIHPELSGSVPYPYGFMLVVRTDRNGAHGVVFGPRSRSEPPEILDCWTWWKEIERVGPASWAPIEDSAWMSLEGSQYYEETIKVGDVVQIDPATPNCFFRGCFAIVTEICSWGALVNVLMPNTPSEMPGIAAFRAMWQAMSYVGQAAWVQGVAREGGVRAARTRNYVKRGPGNAGKTEP